jgi:hypothetical protein
VIYTNGWDLDGAAFAIAGDGPAVAIIILSFGGSPFAPTCGSFIIPTTSCQVLCPAGAAASCSLFSDGESLGILPTSEKGRVKFVVPVPGAGFPAGTFPCNHQAASCGGPPAISDLPTYDVFISPFNVCSYESPDPNAAFYYRGPPQAWIQLPDQTNVFPTPGAIATYAPLLQLSSGSCPFGLVR